MYGTPHRWNQKNWTFYIMPVAFFLLVLAPMLGAAIAVNKVAVPATCASCHGGDKLGDLLAKANKDKAKDKKDKKKEEPPKVAAHYGLRCVSCHQDPKVVSSSLMDKSWTLKPDNPGNNDQKNGKDAKNPKKEAVKALAAGAPAQEPGHDVPDTACSGCHQFKDDKPKEGVMHIAAHKTHAQKKVGCSKCHVSAIHGVKTEDGKLDFPKPKQDTCLECHRKVQQVGVWPPKLMACSTCHVAKMLPGFHEPREDWLKGHGPQALSMGPGMCAGCHAPQKIDPNLDDSKDARLFARNSFWCSSCHMNNRPARHNDIWRIIHKTGALANFQYCGVCHNPNKPDVKKLSTDLEERAVQKIWCNMCHNPPDKSKHEPAADWLPKHYQYVKSQGPVQGNCYNCHQTNHCQVCHNSQTAKVLIEKFRADMRAKGIEPPPPPAGIPGLSPTSSGSGSGG